MGIGTTGSMAAASSSNDGFIAKLDVSSGGAITAFGSAGLQKVTGAVDEEVWDVASEGNDLYAIGTFSSYNTGIGSPGSLSGPSGPDAFVAALNLTTGAANIAFSGDGLVMIASTMSDYGREIIVNQNEVIAVGDFSGNNLGIGAFGALKSSGQNDLFVARLARSNGSAVTSFSDDGLERIGGSGTDLAMDALYLPWNGELIVAADIASADAGYGAAGPWDGESSRAGMVLTVPLYRSFPAVIDVIDTTVVTDGNPHHATVTANPNGLAMAITYNGSATTPSAIGTYTVQATVTQPGFGGSASGTLIIAKAKLTVTAENKMRRRGAAEPPFTATYSGFIGGDTAAIITTPPALTTSATAASGSGSYPITAASTVAPGYLIEHLPGTLRIFDFNVVNVTLRGTVAGGITPTVRVDGSPTIPGTGTWEATGSVPNDALRVITVDANNESGGTDHETITIQAVDLPLGGG